MDGRSIPPQILFGTSSWNYPGWKGQIYHREYKDEAALRQSALEEYAQHPLFRTVGIDSTFYAPPRIETLERYASQVPQEFRWIAKVWEEITAPRFPSIPRYGAKAGASNPHFLSVDRIVERFLPPFLRPGVKEHLGVLVIQFPYIELQNDDDRLQFLERLGHFLFDMPKDIRFAVEIRNPEFITTAISRTYFATLNTSGASHCFNHWTGMPELRTQMLAAADAGGINAPFFVSRILTPLGVKYEQAVKKFSPYREIKMAQPQMRADVVRLCRRAIDRNAEAFVIVNNRCEGNAPQTIEAIGEKLLESLAQRDLDNEEHAAPAISKDAGKTENSDSR